MQESFLKILRTLANHDVKFIVVGGIGAVLQGCPIFTYDLDIVHERSSDNVARLDSALRQAGAVYRFPASRGLTPTTAALAGSGHHLLHTAFGPLDVLGEIGAGHGYDELFKHSETFLVDESLRVNVLSLDWLIRTKEETGAPKDLAVLDLLREVRRQRGEG